MKRSHFIVVAVLLTLIQIGRAGDGRAQKAALTEAATKALAEAKRHFTYNGKPIHPGLVQEFAGWLSDGGPITLSVDVRAGSGSNEYLDDKVKREGLVISYESETAGYYSYQRLGALKDGTQVLRTHSNNGGSGVFMTLFLVRFSTETFTRQDGVRDFRLVMRIVRDVPLGDRDDGKIDVLDDHVRVSRSRYRNSETLVRVDQ